MHAQLSSEDICLNFCLSIHHGPSLVLSSSEGSGETVQCSCTVSPEHSLLAYAISAKILWAGPFYTHIHHLNFLLTFNLFIHRSTQQYYKEKNWKKRYFGANIINPHSVREYKKNVI